MRSWKWGRKMREGRPTSGRRAAVEDDGGGRTERSGTFQKLPLWARRHPLRRWGGLNRGLGWAWLEKRWAEDMRPAKWQVIDE
ncbi:hypothetical protein E2562_014663 [Oryza meyeriana var. granulata]|uniref:Uncharacterized protein n=1 Tax=Oryza meyeriana var. granulata TaxID=110450 RepID=A0A6G1D2Y5_9ORYZ|nr:hypothetical protein E2562_014663 [Oryza meyeriana var. granulata]